MTEASRSVHISGNAFLAIAMHGICHPSSEIHGVLIGKCVADRTEVVEAVPVCHETPTKPLLETALVLVQANKSEKYEIVGWYTCPEHLADKSAGPVASRIVASLSKNSVNPVLLLVDNKTIGDIVGGENDHIPIQCMEKDFGNQWEEPCVVTVGSEPATLKALRAMRNDSTGINDLVDHWENHTSHVWHDSSTYANDIGVNLS